MKVLVVLGILGLTLIGFFSSSTPEGSELRKRARLVSPPKELIYFTFGYNESISDGLWLRLLQDFDASCEPGKSHETLPATGELPKGLFYTTQGDDKVTGGGLENTRFCHKTWIYHMIDRITDLTPRFRLPYVLGATILSVSANDIEGARLIFEKGIQQYPKDWSLAYRAAYHFIYEVGDQKRAADLLVQAGQNGAPKWVFSLASRLYSKSGQLFLAKTTLEDALSNVRDDPAVKQRIEERLVEVNKQIAELQKTEGSEFKSPSSEQPQ